MSEREKEFEDAMRWVFAANTSGVAYKAICAFFDELKQERDEFKRLYQQAADIFQRKYPDQKPLGYLIEQAARCERAERERDELKKENETLKARPKYYLSSGLVRPLKIGEII